MDGYNERRAVGASGRLIKPLIKTAANLPVQLGCRNPPVLTTVPALSASITSHSVELRANAYTLPRKDIYYLTLLVSR